MPEQPSGGRRGLASLAYLGPLVIVPLLKRKKERFLYYHTRQGLYLFGVFVVFFVVTLGLLYIFSPNALDVRLLFQVLSVVILLELFTYVVLSIVLAIAAWRGRYPMLPVLGEMAGEG